MRFLTEQERSFLQVMSTLGSCNPFLPERVVLERQVLGSEFVSGHNVWKLQVDDPEAPERASRCFRGVKRKSSLRGRFRFLFLLLAFFRFSVEIYIISSQGESDNW